MFKKYFLFLIFFFFTAFFQSQLKEDFGYFTDKAYEKLYNDPEHSLDFSQNLVFNEKNPDKVIYQNIIAQTYAMKGDYLNSVKSILGSEDIKTENHSDFHQFFINYCLADQYQNLGLYEQSQKIIFQILSKKKFPNHPQIAITLGKVYQLQAINYAVVKNYKLALEYLGKSDDYLKDKTEQSEILNTENELFRGVIFINQKKTDSAKSIFEKVLKQNILNKYAFLYALARENSARVYFLKQDYRENDALLLEALERIEKTDYFPLKNRIYESLSRSYLAQNKGKEYQNYRSLFEEGKTEMDDNKRASISYLVNVIEDFNQEEYGFYKNNIDDSRNIVAGICLALVLSFSLFYFLTEKKKKDLKKQINFFENYLSKTNKDIVTQAISDISIAEIESENDNENKRSSIISPEKTKELLSKLKDFENSDLFLSKQVSLPFLAAKLDTNIKYLSEVIKHNKGKKFNSYINDLRIQYVINLLKTDPSYLNYKVSYLAEVTGFSSHSAFTAVFKSITGMSPNDFIQQINLQKKG